MSLSDWTDKKNGAKMSLSGSQVIEGLKSLQIIDMAGDDVIKTLDKSEIDSPTAIVVEFWAYQGDPGSQTRTLGIFFRYQDNDNFYAAQIYCIGGLTDQMGFTLGKREAGVWSDAGKTYFGNFLGQWVKYKVKMCELGGTIHAELYREVDSSWVYVMEKTLSPALWAAGGACGVGSPNGAHGNQANYIDTTRIYY